MKATIKFEARVPVEVFEGTSYFVANCPIFDISSQGKDAEDAKANLTDAITGFLLTCFDMGTLDEMLKKCGFKHVKTIVQEEYIEMGEDYIDIPLPFMIPDGTTKECHA